jgi:hypothetical protein
MPARKYTGQPYAVPFVPTTDHQFVREAVAFDNERGVTYREVGGGPMLASRTCIEPEQRIVLHLGRVGV